MKENKREEFSTAEKLLSKRVVNKEIVRSTMAKIRKTSKSFTILNLSSNLFVISFEVLEDKERVLKGRPWLFDNFLFNLKPLDGFTPPSLMDFTTTVFWI